MKTILVILLSTFPALGIELTSQKHIRYQQTPGVSPVRQILDVHYDAQSTNTPKPVILWVHGGAWKFGNKTHSTGAKAKTFVDAGYVLVAMNYRFHPQATWKDQAGDVAAASKWIQSNIKAYGGDPSRIVFMGHSAGAHLAALTAADPRYLKKAGVPYHHIKAAVLLDGAGYDLHTVMQTSQGRHIKLYQEIFGNNPNQLKAASPTQQFGNKRSAPDYLIIPVSNRAITLQQSKNLAAAIQKSGNHAEIFVAENRNHMTLNSKIGEAGDAPTKAILEFLNKQVK